MRLPLTIFLVLLVLAAFQGLYEVPQLSDPVATKFGASGQPVAWQSRASFQATHLVTVGVVAVVLGGIPLLLRAVPVSMVNVPHRDYYLAPPRRQDSLRFLDAHTMWLAAGTMALMLCVMQLVIDGNLSGAHRVPSSAMWIVLGGYLAFMAWWLVRMFTRFRRPPAGATTA
jgi:hypothetical protein